jgi:methylphosphotriester-DNA--protein-cysteine methyltransferase
VDAVEHFLLRMQRPAEADPLVQRAVERIADTGGTLRIAHLQRELCISASPLEKRFRSIVGCTPKTFSSIVRFRAVLRSLELGGTPAAAGYDNRYFDQAHFIRDFVRFTGTTPEKFRKSL